MSQTCPKCGCSRRLVSDKHLRTMDYHLIDGPQCLRNQLTRWRDLAERMGRMLKGASWVLESASINSMGGTPDLFGPDIDGCGMVAEPGEDCWDTWDRYGKQIREDSAALLTELEGMK